MRYSPRWVSRYAHLTIALLVIVGLEIDVLSNPVTPELVFQRALALLDSLGSGSSGWSSPGGADPIVTSPLARKPFPCDGLSLSSASALDSVLPPDETVAVLPKVKAPVHTHLGTIHLSLPLPPDCSGLQSAPPFDFISLISPQPRLCRFRC